MDLNEVISLLQTRSDDRAKKQPIRVRTSNGDFYDIWEVSDVILNDDGIELQVFWKGN